MGRYLIKIDDIVLDPQSTTFDFVTGPPRVVGDACQIREHHTGWGVYPSTAEQLRTVVLIADWSGRLWLVEFPS